LELSTKSPAGASHADVAEFARQMAMQVVANNGRFVRREDVSPEVVAKEKEIALEFTKSEADKAIEEVKRVIEDYKGQLVEQTTANNAEAIAELTKRIGVAEKQLIAAEGRKKSQLSNIEKIISGRVDKYFAEVCLLEQSYFRDPDKKVIELLAELSKKIGEEVSVVRFTRYTVGETAAE
jgi:elongation factor Ts